MFGFSLSNSFAETSDKSYGGREADGSGGSNYISCLGAVEGGGNVR